MLLSGLSCNGIGIEILSINISLSNLFKSIIFPWQGNLLQFDKLPTSVSIVSRFMASFIFESFCSSVELLELLLLAAERGITCFTLIPTK